MIQLILSIIAFLYCPLGVLFFLLGTVKSAPLNTKQRYKSLAVAFKLEIITLISIGLKFILTKIC